MDPASDKRIAQHNALINARFSFVPLQMRLFVALLSRIDFEDIDFKEHFIPLDELVFDRRGGSAYEQVDEMCKGLASFTLYIEELEEKTRRRGRKPSYTYIPLMAEAGYRADLGGVTASFNPKIMPYLLQLRESGNFTTAEIQQVLKLKSPQSLRIYWLLKEYADFGRRTISVEELRFVLGIEENEYPRFSNFKARVLNKAQSEISGTDIPFTYELEREGKTVARIKFLFRQLASSATKKTLPVDTEWAEALLQIGLSQRSIISIATQLENDEYDVGYIAFVVRIVESQFRKGKIKKPAGAIYKALAEKYLLEDYVLASKPRSQVKKELPKAMERQPEVAFRLSEVRQMYDNPGPYAQRRKRAPSFEEHVQEVYYNEGFEKVQREGEDWLVKASSKSGLG
ncbi:initiator RepB protein [Hymenobacter roseosalivarius DSM 11622]|uniref:Initiator RepB protein n=1 Tax=Hymenobacter roseosalivarius DSM 11622 TaxID=645990 RepID=A0A1W1W6B3_9BACT|nr:replication initiation protein [Hymenobacter roseosalivarius]SMC00634.1 initiator RepB protein [Hymenobacter roseosalivarius DSM 11622]